jgi:hypothetical protein
MTHSATLPQRFMLEHNRPRVIPMTLRAILVQPRHRQSTRWLENVSSVRIVALNTIHVTFNHWVTLRHSKFCLRLQMTLKTRHRIFARVHNKFASPTARLDMFAPGPMT